MKQILFEMSSSSAFPASSSIASTASITNTISTTFTTEACEVTGKSPSIKSKLTNFFSPGRKTGTYVATILTSQHPTPTSTPNSTFPSSISTPSKSVVTAMPTVFSTPRTSDLSPEVAGTFTESLSSSTLTK